MLECRLLQSVLALMGNYIVLCVIWVETFFAKSDRMTGLSKYRTALA